MVSGKRYWSDWTPVAGQQYEYAFDDIGNRTSTKAGGDDAGGALRSASYTANSLNQYTSRDVPAYLNVLGIANANASVTVNSQSAYRKGEYFQKELSVNNASAAQWQRGGKGLYCFVGNQSLKSVDTLGLSQDPLRREWLGPPD